MQEWSVCYEHSLSRSHVGEELEVIEKTPVMGLEVVIPEESVGCCVWCQQSLCLSG